MNTCAEIAQQLNPKLYTLVYYSHIIPIFIIALLTIFILLKSRFSLLSRIFSLFALVFSLWLIGDVIAWIPFNYDSVSLVWAPLDYINIMFCLLGAYFFVVMINGNDAPIWQKLIFFAASLPAWWLTVTGQSIFGFNQPLCESFNNTFLTQYKLGVEILVIIFIVAFALYQFKKSPPEKRKQIIIVGSTLVFFFAVFGGAEYMSSQTGVYEISLYSLFVLPVFLFMITYSITNLKVFNLRLIGSQLLAYIMIIMVGSQFFFLQNSTDKALTAVTFILSLSFGVLLARDAKKEIKQREEIEKLAGELRVANEGQASLMHFMNHQVKGRFGNARNIFAELLTSDYGEIPEFAKPLLEKGLEETKMGVDYVQGILRGASAENGTLPYDMQQIDLKSIVEEVSEKQKEYAEKKGLVFDLKVLQGDYRMVGDPVQLGESVKNLIDNSINYTIDGSITVTLSSDSDTVRLEVRDTGMGITLEDRSKLFKSGGRGADSLKVNVNSTGYGLAFVKGVVDAHKGKVWAESEGRDKGSTFFIELPRNLQISQTT